MKITTNALASKLGLDYVETRGFLAFLVKNGHAKEIGKEPRTEGAKGKPATIWEISNQINLTFEEPVPAVVPVAVPTS